ncbi:hypothetical protein V2G26_001159 [Clonostachys chloroleuca]
MRASASNNDRGGRAHGSGASRLGLTTGLGWRGHIHTLLAYLSACQAEHGELSPRFHLSGEFFPLRQEIAG